MIDDHGRLTDMQSCRTVGRQTRQYPNDDPGPAMNFPLHFGALNPQPGNKRATQNEMTPPSFSFYGFPEALSDKDN